MKLQVGEFLIESDSLQFVVKERRIAQEGKNKGEEYYTNPKYIVRFVDVIKYITDQILRTNDDMNEILNKLKQINLSISALERYPIIYIKPEREENIESEEK
jgi:hypothetical protein